MKERKTMFELKLQEIIDNARNINTKYVEQSKNIIYGFCKELKPLLRSLKEAGKIIYDEDGLNDTEVIFLKYVNYYTGIRYLGRFYNMIEMEKKESQSGTGITLMWASYEDEESLSSFKDDGYFGEESERHEKKISLYDIEAFKGLVNSLMPFFKKVPTYDAYNNFAERVNRNNEADRIRMMLNSDIDEMLFYYIDHCFERHNDYIKGHKKHFMMLPNDVCVRYYGRFHNCIISDRHSISLGYIKNLSDKKGEDYYSQDIYTVDHSGDRYCEKPYELIHEISLITHDWPTDAIIALQAINDICGEELENGKLEYINSYDVKYTRTIFTD